MCGIYKEFKDLLSPIIDAWKKSDSIDYTNAGATQYVGKRCMACYQQRYDQDCNAMASYYLINIVFSHSFLHSHRICVSSPIYGRGHE